MRPIRLALFSSRCKTCHISRINCVCRTKTVTNCSYVNKQIHLTLLSIDIEIPQTSFDRHILGYRQAGWLQLSHSLLPEMCGLRTRPRTDVDPPRLLPPSNCHRRGGHIVSPLPGRYLAGCYAASQHCARSAGRGLLLPMSHVARSLCRTHYVLCKNGRTDREPVYKGVDWRWLEEPYISWDHDSPREGIGRRAAVCQIFSRIALFSDKSDKMVRPAVVYDHQRALQRSRINFTQSELSLQVRTWTLLISAVNILALSMRILCPKRGAKMSQFATCQLATAVFNNNLSGKLTPRLAQSVFSRYLLIE